jgi:hypothetical protein
LDKHLHPRFLLLQHFALKLQALTRHIRLVKLLNGLLLSVVVAAVQVELLVLH